MTLRGKPAGLLCCRFSNQGAGFCREIGDVRETRRYGAGLRRLERHHYRRPPTPGSSVQRCDCDRVLGVYIYGQTGERPSRQTALGGHESAGAESIPAQIRLDWLLFAFSNSALLHHLGLRLSSDRFRPSSSQSYFLHVKRLPSVPILRAE